MLECYWAYADVNQMRDFCEEMIRAAVFRVLGHTHVRYGDVEIDFAQPFERQTMREAIGRNWGKASDTNLIGGNVDILKLNDLKYVQELVTATRIFENRLVSVNFHKSHFAARGGQLPQEEARYFDGIREKAHEVVNDPSYKPRPSEPEEMNVDKGIAYLFDYAVEGSLTRPTFITDFPKAISPLSKESPSDPSVAERFELYIAGMKCANGF